MDIEELTNLSMQIIAYVGDAKSHAIEAIRVARTLKTSKEIDSKTSEIISKAKASLAEGGKVHMTALAKEAEGVSTTPTILFMHAEDQMISAETIIAMAIEIIELTKIVVTK